MTREEKIDAFAMRLDGYSLQAIGDKYGVTRERIRQIFIECLKLEIRKYDFKYVNLKKWLDKNHYTLNDFAKMIGVKSTCISTRMNGHSEFKQSEIKKILEITGMTYEEAFKYVEPHAE